jgi:hypothetical protein
LVGWADLRLVERRKASKQQPGPSSEGILVVEDLFADGVAWVQAVCATNPG